MSAKSDNSYEAFEKINFPKIVTEIDYVQTIYKAIDIPIDFLLQFAKIFWPSFLLIDGKVFLKNLYESEKYDALLSTDSNAAQYWINLLEITGLFEDLSFDQAHGLAEIIAACWNSKIKVEFGSGVGYARSIANLSTREVFVSIDSKI